MIYISSANIRIFFDNFSVSFNTLLPALSKTLYSNVKFNAAVSENINKIVSIRCQLKNSIQVIYSLQGQTDGSRKVPDVGCGQKGEEEFVPFIPLPHLCASWCEVGHCPKGEKDVFYVSVRRNSKDIE
jgi:hypothetical protein